MELQLITFEQAKALQELGFPQKINNFNYLCTSGFSIDGKETSMISSVNKLEYIAPPLDLVAKWLRDEKDIHISCEFEPLCDSYGNVIGYEYNVMIVKLMLDNQETETTWLDHYKTYEEALSAGIDKAIEIL